MVFQQGRYISFRRTILLTSDIFCMASSILASAVIRLGPEEGFDYVAKHLPSLGGSVIIFLLVFYASGMYERASLTRKRSTISMPLTAVAIGLGLVILAFYARFQFHIGRGILLMAGGFIFVSSWLVRHLYRLAVLHGFLSRNALVIGDGREVSDAINLIRRTPDAGYKVLGVVSCKRAQPGQFVEGVPIVGAIDKLRELADAFSAETLIVATALSREPAVLRLLRPLRCAGTEVMDFVSLHEVLAQEILLDHINDEWLMNAAMNSSVIHIRKIKRVMDVLVAVAGLILSFPVCILTTILIRLDSPGSILYHQRRSGLGGRPYTLYKFRTMRQDAEATSGAVWAQKFDARVTKVGKFLRKWRVDEIPQLINVLRGEMSLVGPRPERPEFVDTLAGSVPFYKERLLVPPGVTGWAQVKYPYAASIEAARRKLQYDLYYIKHMSFSLDSLILLRTFKTINVGLRHSDSGQERPAGAAVIPMPDAGKTDSGVRMA